MALALDDPRHGTVNGYNNHGCRCKRCREAIRVYQVPRNREWRHRTGRHKPREEWLTEVLAPCGTEAAYARGCRCDDCRRAARVGRAKRRLTASQSEGV